jgi:hypothetical protein
MTSAKIESRDKQEHDYSNSTCVILIESVEIFSFNVCDVSSSSSNFVNSID